MLIKIKKQLLKLKAENVVHGNDTKKEKTGLRPRGRSPSRLDKAHNVCKAGVRQLFEDLRKQQQHIFNGRNR